MKILIDLTSLADNFSGIERFALSITQELVKDANNQYILIFKNKIHEAFKEEMPNVEKYVIRSNHKLIAAQIKLPIELTRHKADIYFFPAFTAPFFFFSRKSVSTIHDLGCWDCPSANKKIMDLYFQILNKKAAANSKYIVTVSNFSKDRIEKILHVNKDNIFVIYNGISDYFRDKTSIKPFNEITEKYKLPNEYILCLSTVEPRKNMRLLIDAYSDMYSEGELSTDLVLAGRKGWLVDDILSGITDEVLEHIHFTGFIDDQDLPSIYHYAQLFVFPSLYEGFGIPPLEAMASGTIVLSSDATSMPEVCGDAALYFKNNDKEDLRDKILYSMQLDENQKNKIIANGIEQSKLYGWDNEASKLTRYFNTITG